jgi:CRISPR-associated endonuclease/helicase Cas3
MATANAMYMRMGNCYRKLFAEKENPSIVLTHGSRHLSEEFRSSILMNTSDETIISTDEKKAEINSGKYHCTSWLADSTKKSLLADIGVGTIDQLLLSILPVRYQDLRYYGMTKKILVVDEVHAYDPYMNKLLCAVIKAHASSGGSAILLSATIPQVVKNQLTESFYAGTGGDNSYVPQNNAFPLLTKADMNNGIKEIAADSDQEKRNVNIEFLYDEAKVCSHIKKKLDENLCVSWIRNTVYDVFTAYEKLTREYGVNENDIIVFHSRFAFADRNKIEEKVLRLFGKESEQSERAGKVVIATQVIEQSLDLDFDGMISDLAPIELLIQRAGRLHRHGRGKRDGPVMYIYSPPETNSPDADWYKRVFPKAAFVYNNTTILWRTKEMLKREKAIILPQRARVLIESVYGEDPINAPECFIENETESEGERMAQEDTADFSKLFIEEGYCRESARNKWDEEEKISTRLSEEQTTVYLCRFDREEVKPLYDGDFPWEMSSLKIRKGSIGEIQYPREIKKAISKVKEKRKFREDDMFLVAENQVKGLDVIVDMELENEKITYSSFFGLRVDKKIPT